LLTSITHIADLKFFALSHSQAFGWTTTMSTVPLPMSAVRNLSLFTP
jgi:hypothetical protein